MLPEDLFGRVADLLSQDDIAALRGVCQSLRLAVDLSTTHATLHPNASADELRSITNRCTGLHSIKLQRLHPGAAKATLDALAAMQHLRSLDMPMLHDMQLGDWTRLSRLTGLTLRSVNHSHHGTLVATLPRLTALRSLVLVKSRWMVLLDADMQPLASLSRLTHLDLGSTDGVAALAAQLPNLQSLALQLGSSPQAASQKELSTLSSLTKLKHLSLAASLTDAHLASLSLGANVAVSFSDVPIPQSQAPLPHDAMLPLQGIRHLAALQVWANPPNICCRYNQGGVLEATPPYDKLLELRLESCDITAAVDKLAAVAGRLRVLHIKRCRGAFVQLLCAAVAAEDVALWCGDAGGKLLQALRPAAGSLRTLDITRQAHEHWDAERLAEFTGLTKLAYRTDDTGTDAIGAMAGLTRLRELQLGAPSLLSDRSLARLSTLSRLTSLDIAGDHHGSVSGGFLAALAAARIPLRHLRLIDGAITPGCGAEAAIGRLTRLTSLHMSVRRVLQQPPSVEDGSLLVPLQLQLLGCGSTARGGGGATGRNTSLQDLTLACNGQLYDEELAAAAVALPDLRQLELGDPGSLLRDLTGEGLAAFSACRRLRCISLEGCCDLDRRQLLAHVPRIGSLDTVMLRGDDTVADMADMRELQDAFAAQHGRYLSMHSN